MAPGHERALVPVTAEQVARWIEQGDIPRVAATVRAAPALVHVRLHDDDQLLHRACWHKQPGAMAVLLEAGPDLNAHGCFGRTPLHSAVHEGSPISVSIVGTLLAVGADPSLRDENGFTPEDWAKIEMDDGLTDVLAQLRRQWRPSDGGQ